ncbi:hypothetical protein JCM19055_2140 [Geomicrobium sp. JCM 19055]|nr:hypothetical protein JCM19055_2140 [Geomicrobium sp. JCM 19055]
MAEVKKQKVKPMRWGYLGLLILPSVASFAAAASPVWSQAFAWGFASIIALLFIYSVVFVLLKQYEQEPLRLLYGTIVINISTVIILIASWRVFNENIWLGLLLLSLFICHVTFGITHRKRVNDAIRNPKKTPNLTSSVQKNHHSTRFTRPCKLWVVCSIRLLFRSRYDSDCLCISWNTFRFLSFINYSFITHIRTTYE